MAKTNRTCFCCTNKYYYCQGCADERRPTWMIMFDTEECKSIFQICSSYNGGSYTKKEARDLLEKIGLNDFDSYEKSITSTLKEIFAEDKKEDKTAKAEKATKVEVNDKTDSE